MAAAGAWVSVEPNHGQEENEPDSTVQEPGACLAWLGGSFGSRVVPHVHTQFVRFGEFV